MSDRPDPTRAAELAAMLAKAYPAARPAMVARVMVEAVRLARYAKARAEIERSYPMTEENCNRAARRIERAAIKLNSELMDALRAETGGTGIAAPWPWFTFGGDPRGTCGKLRIPGMDGDGWGRDGFPLY